MAKWEGKLAIILGGIVWWMGLCAHAQEGRTNEGSDRTQSTSTSRPTKKHYDAKDDITAIGNRNIGGTGAGNWYSLASEIRMGREYSQAVDSQVKLLDDPVVTEYVNRIGQNLVRNSDARVPFTIKVIDSEEVNAFSIPGGFLYVNAGLILAADDEAELAGAMAHEIAHIAARHATRQMTRSNLVSMFSIPLIFVGGGVGVALQGMVGVGTPLAFTKFSRAFEAEADYLGLEYLYQTGYDPEALISFFEKVQAMERDKPGVLARAFASHPQTADRVKKSQAEIARILPVRDQYVVTTSDFEVMKARLSEIEENRHRSQDRPMLRRRVAAPTDSDNSADDTDRPVLKRREQK
jgi:beta-barrel assembly-enhancing protease